MWQEREAKIKEHITQECVNRVIGIMKDDDRLKHSDVIQTSFGRLMCQEFNYLRDKVNDLRNKTTLGKPIEQLSLDVLQRKIEMLEKRLNDLEKDPEKLLRLSIDNFTLDKE
jgi:hypothetical protein